MVTVRFFALLKEMAGKEELEFPLKGEMPLKDFMNKLEDTMPDIVEMVRKRRVLVSVNQEFATMDTIIKDGDEIALLPPFSGGTQNKTCKSYKHE